MHTVSVIQETSSSTKKNNTHTLYLGLLIFVSLAWIATLLFWFFLHKPCPVCRDVVVKHAQPTHVPVRVPFRGTFHVPLFSSPGTSTNLQAVLDYLKKKGTTVHGQPFDADIFKALNMPWLWQWNTNTEPPTGLWTGNQIIARAYYLVFDVTQNQWTITSTAP